MLSATGEVLSHKKYGDYYHSLTIVAPAIGETIKPGQFVNIHCGTERSFILRRPFSVYRVHKRGGWAATLEVVFDVRGPGTKFLSTLRQHAAVNLIGPLGRGFSLPARRAHCLLVGGGVGAVPLFFLADELRNAGHRVDVVLGARSGPHLLNAIEVRRLASVSRLTTEDGSTGDRGRVTDVLPGMIERCGSEVVYTCGPHPMLAAVTAMCVERNLAVEVAVEELMGCGYGVCMSCVLPVRARDGKDRNGIVYARSCTEGPVFDGAAVVWDGAADIVALDQSELSPVGMPVRQTAYLEPANEHAPPGN
jgi:dihydroorotate dehydrogenase electron transfer subunit